MTETTNTETETCFVCNIRPVRLEAVLVRDRIFDCEDQVVIKLMCDDAECRQDGEDWGVIYVDSIGEEQTRREFDRAVARLAAVEAEAVKVAAVETLAAKPVKLSPKQVQVLRYAAIDLPERARAYMSVPKRYATSVRVLARLGLMAPNSLKPESVTALGRAWLAANPEKVSF